MRKYYYALLLMFMPFVAFAQEDLDSKYAVNFLKPGTVAPAIMVERDGGMVNLIDVNKGRYVVLEFWASWCGDCRRDMKHMRAISDRYRSDDVMIQGYSFDKDPAAYDKCCRDSLLSWNQEMSPVPMRDSDVAKAYHLNWIPSYYLLDKSGNILLSTVMVEKIQDALDRITRK